MNLYDIEEEEFDLSRLMGFPPIFQQSLPLSFLLKTGLNPHQKAALYGNFESFFECTHKTTLSYEALVNISSALYLMGEFEKPCIAFLRYGSPLLAVSRMDLTAWVDERLKNYTQDLMGSTLVMNRTLDLDMGYKLASLKVETLLAPHFEEGLATVLKTSHLLVPKTFLRAESLMEMRGLAFGLLLQDRNRAQPNGLQWSGIEWLGELGASALFAWRLAKHVRSPSAIFVKDEEALAIASGPHDYRYLPALALEIAEQRSLSLEQTVILLDGTLGSKETLLSFAKFKPSLLMHQGFLDTKLKAWAFDFANEQGFKLLETGVFLNLL